MFINSDKKNDPKQCTVSKLGRVHSVHTQNLSHTSTAPKLHARRTLSSWEPCRNAVSRTRCRVARCCAVSQHKNRVTIQKPCHAHYYVVSRARCRLPLLAGQAVSFLGARLHPACRDTIHFVATKTGKWAVAHSSFISCTFFFFFSNLLVEHQKIIVIFSYFTYCKTNRKIFLNIFFFQNLPIASTKPTTLRCSSLTLQTTKKYINLLFIYISQFKELNYNSFSLCENWNNLP